MIEGIFAELMAEHVKNPAAFGVSVAVKFAGIVEVVADDGFAVEIGFVEPLVGVLPTFVVGLVLAEVRFRPHVFHEGGEAFVEPDVSPVFAGD